MKAKILCVLCVFLIIACKKQDTTPTCDPNISYSTSVQAVFISNCTSVGCHDGNALPSLAEYSTAHDAATQIRNSVGKGRMPLNKTISEKDKAEIQLETIVLFTYT